MSTAYTIGLVATVASALLGCLGRSTIRTSLIATIWLAPLWFASWFTAAYSADIAYEFGDWWAYLAFTPLFLAAWAAVTLFPFMLVKRLLEIQRQR
ncbi:hypothetical protein A8V01_27355 [Novosphingobium guangzhouense]|uniref:Uncharacterized protein n=1 Tax=Novosphingobium guangzhouense TaxID=1850347 RepID=A0A2K2FSB1_9SPHN|nr:hypothetical protein A8V01_27355 [Novosphingobium guangzhouense]